MPFSEVLKLAVKRKAHFSCCLCHDLSVEIHHIVPQGEGGPDTEANAAPLCPSCHETYGANSQKQKFIREARDFWYELCEKRYASDAGRLEKILTIVQETASKDDLENFVDKIAEFQQTIDSSLAQVVDRERYISQIDQMQQKLLNAENEIKTKSRTLLQLRKREAVTQVGVQIAAEMAREGATEKDLKFTEAYGRASGVLIKMGNLSTGSFVQIFRDAFKDGPVPEGAISETLYYLSVIYKLFVQLIASINISSSVVPVILDEYDKNPTQPVKKLQQLLAAHIRAGKLDEIAPK